MKKMIILFLSVLILTSCRKETGSGEYFVLPDLNGYTTQEIVELFTENDQTYRIKVFDEEIEIFDNQFIMYENFNTSDIVDKQDEVIIIVYPPFSGQRTFVVLPDLTGFTKQEIELYFNDFGVALRFSEQPGATFENQTRFIRYGGISSVGDHHSIGSVLSVVIYEEYIDPNLYFSPLELEYDGPYLDLIEYAGIDAVNPRGGYVAVELVRCLDGDTAIFDYPVEIYNEILSTSKSTRFLNMDTEETFNGGEEEWGKPGSVYTCSLLQDAKSIILQTDPGDALTGTYGRLLAWIWIQLPGETNYQLLNYMVVKQGLAQVKYEFGAGLDLYYGDYSYNEWMHIAEDYAIENELGQWGNLKDYYWDYQNNQPNYFRWHE